jgi:protein TonB
MYNQNVFLNNFDDVVFEDRNKAYGAYALRRLSDKNTIKAMMYAGLFISALLTLIIINRKETSIEELSGIVILDPPPNTLSTSIKPKPIVPVQSTSQAPPSKSKQPSTDIVPTKVVANTIPMENPNIEPSHVQGASVGNENNGIEVENPTSSFESGLPSGEDKYQSTISTETEDPNKIILFSDVMPTYPGGTNALIDFLRKNIKYPPFARENEIEGNVILTFIVQADGSINNVKVLRGIGYGCDDEALRVVKRMPMWSPGKMKGKNVNVRYTLPIKFELAK